MTSCRQESAVAEANKKGLFLFENGAEPRTVDPQLSTEMNTSNILYALFEGLVVSDPVTMKPAAIGAAKSWDISEDRLIYTFHLRENGSWSNGDPVTAHDFRYSYQRMLEPALASRYAYMLYPIKNGEKYHKGELDDFSQVGVRALDDLTLEITLAAPTPYLTDLMTHPSWQPVHPPSVEKHGGMTDLANEWTRKENIVGNGPFRLKEWIPTKHIDVVRREEYWDAENVKLNACRFYPIDNTETAQRAFRREAVHITDTIPPHRVVWGKKNTPELMRTFPALGVYYYRINIGPDQDGDSDQKKEVRRAMRKKDVRQALSLAINREAICDFLKSGQRPATHFVPPGTGSYTSPEVLEYDPQKARKLLAEAGYPGGEGFPQFTLIYNTMESHRQIAEILQSQWSNELGISMTLANQEWKVFNDTLHSMNYEVARSAWFGDYNDPNTFLDMWLTGGGNNETGYSSERYDQLIKQAALTGSEPEKRMKIFYEAEKLLLEDLPIIPLYFYVTQHMVHPTVKGWHDNVMDDHLIRFLDVERN